MHRYAFPLAIAALLGVVVLFYQNAHLKDDLEKASRISEGRTDPKQGLDEHPIEVAEYMSRIQSFTTKLWAAGNAENTPLVHFYLHELEEAMETVADAKIEDDSIDISQNMEQIGLTALHTIDKVIDTDGLDSFKDHYSNLVQACNACHSACNYPFIRVQVPNQVRFGEQDFSPITIK